MNETRIWKQHKTRPVILTDLDDVYAMLVELVEHEGLTDRFKMTRSRLENELLSENADWYCLVATDLANNPIGFCLYTKANINRAFNTSSMFQLDDLFVKIEWRRKGIGESLLRHVIQIARDQGVGRINVWCVRDNVQGQHFYKKMQAEKRDFIDVFSIQTEKF